ncbi:sulfurtransferase TusA family protein [Cellulomonas sp. P24]|uniref:sulfurtransferase TusA family protein n=1 Tax=Cellulomonas sp. P24 TaxID=2885206 RepID=UPI00286FD2FE|nr:sulfurtransferase TusA family protein [Cellulomonas sp. P24]MCR6494202.1 sulfurtransferase TusA family protein [Cellulomonas sp. P24]
MTPRTSGEPHDDRPGAGTPADTGASADTRSPADPASPAGAVTPRGAPTIVDARGVRCPMPVIMIARAAAALPGGSLVTVIATDPAARHDVPAWARMRGHTVVDDDAPAASPAGEIRLTVRLAGDD